MLKVYQKGNTVWIPQVCLTKMAKYIHEHVNT